MHREKKAPQNVVIYRVLLSFGIICFKTPRKSRLNARRITNRKKVLFFGNLQSARTAGRNLIKCNTAKKVKIAQNEDAVIEEALWKKWKEVDHRRRVARRAAEDELVRI